MEKSMNGAVEPAQNINLPSVFMAVCGFALYWGCFFTMLMRNSFMDAAIEELWYHLFLRIVFLVGSAAICIVIARKADWFSSERGRRLQKAGIVLFSAVAAVSSFTAYTLETALPLAFDFVAWSLAGMGLACLLMIWVELIAALPKRHCAAALVASMALGGPTYLIMNLLPFPFNIGMLCLCPLASLGISELLERDPSIVMPAFVPLDESRKKTRFAPLFKVVCMAYGIVFGVGIGATTQFGESDLLLGAIALVLVAGAGAAWLVLRTMPDLARRMSSLRLLFPVLIVALIPMSFLQGPAAASCNMLLLGCYVFFEALGIELALDIAGTRNASRLHLVGSTQACLYVGLLLGHAIGLAVTSSGVMDYPMLSMAALALVVLLAVIITFAPLSPLADTASKHSEPAGAEEQDASNDTWQAHCERVAKDAGLSARETEVFMLLAKGRGIEHIQNKLCISGHTVKTHVYNIYRKMDINSREELLDAVEQEQANRKAE